MVPRHVVHPEVYEQQNHDLRRQLQIIHQVFNERLIRLRHQNAEDHYQNHHQDLGFWGDRDKEVVSAEDEHFPHHYEKLPVECFLVVAVEEEAISDLYLDYQVLVDQREVVELFN